MVTDYPALLFHWLVYVNNHSHYNQSTELIIRVQANQKKSPTSCSFTVLRKETQLRSFLHSSHWGYVRKLYNSEWSKGMKIWIPLKRTNRSTFTAIRGSASWVCTFIFSTHGDSVVNKKTRNIPPQQSWPWSCAPARSRLNNRLLKFDEYEIGPN